MYPREVVEELNALSKEVTGSKSKWRKLIEKGEQFLVTEECKFLSIKDGKEVTEMVQTPVFHVGPSGAELHQHAIKRHTIESVKEYLLQLKAKQEEFKAMIKKMEEEIKLKEAAKQEVAKGSGSSV